MAQLDYVKVETQSQPDAAVIWLHGLGADGHDFESIVPALSLPKHYAIRFIFPHAPHRPVTINGGMRMRAWYDILEISLERKVDMTQIELSTEQISALIEEQIKQGIPSERIVLAGFSQGGVITYQTALLGSHKLAGIMALSTYVVDADLIPEADNSINHNTPILIHHGSQDPIVPIELATSAREVLNKKGYQVTSKDYAMPHSVCPEQIVDISAWLQECLTGSIVE